MDYARAQELLENMVAFDQEPTLTPDQVASLLASAVRKDSDGLAPIDTGWTGTYDLNAAAAEGWRWKAAKVAAEFDFTTDQQTFDRTAKHAQCLAMAVHYQKRVSGSIKVGTGLPIIPPPIVLIPTEEPFLP